MAFRFSIFWALAMLSPWALADNPCKSLAGGISITYPAGTPGLVKAGETVQLAVKVTVADRKLLDPFDNVPLTFYFSNGQYGSNAFFQFLEIKKTSGKGVSYQEDFTVPLPFGPNTFGYYGAKAGMTFVTKESYCSEIIYGTPHDLIVVVNDPAKADVTAPIITTTAPDRAEYAMGNAVTVGFEAIDQSPLCTQDLVDSKKCSIVWHLAVVNETSGKEVDVYPPTYPDGPGKFKTSFVLRSKDDKGNPLFVPGTYRFTGINVGDVWGNTIHELAKQAQSQFTVR